MTNTQTQTQTRSSWLNQVLIGAGVGIVTTGAWVIVGLPVVNFRSLLILNCAVGVAASIGGAQLEAQKYPKRLKAQGDFLRNQTLFLVERNVGRISERYAQSPDHQDLLVALEELKSEITTDIDRL